jgi:hypothetical protein
LSAEARKQRDTDLFWERVGRELAPHVSQEERREQAIYDDGLALIQELEADKPATNASSSSNCGRGGYRRRSRG